MILPKEKVPKSVKNPRLLLMYGKPKSGKTTIASKLKGNLIVDLEGGSQYLDALAVQARTLQELVAVINALKIEKEKTGKNPYPYITLDSGTALESIAEDLGLILYQRTRMGKTYRGKILDLPNGAGYKYVRDAFLDLLEQFMLYTDHLILMCHSKDIMIEKEGKEMSEIDVDLTGKLGRIVTSRADAVGLFYREKNRNILNFKGDGTFISEARIDHLRGQVIEIGSSDENNNITTNWNLIYK